MVRSALILSSFLVSLFPVSMPAFAAHPAAEGLEITATYVKAPFDKVPRMCRDGADVAGGAVVRSVRNGNWSDPGTWGGTVPAANAKVIVTHQVTYDVASDAAIQCIEISGGGQLVFATDRSTKLRLHGELFVMPDGNLTIGTEANPIPADKNVEISFTDQAMQTGAVGSPGPDPQQLGKGLVNFGHLTMHGHKKNFTFLRATGDLKAGQTQIQLVQAPTGWRAGDRILLPDTKQSPLAAAINYNGRAYPATLQWELTHTIAAVNGNTITLAEPLKYDHLCARNADAESFANRTIAKRRDGEQLCAHIANLSRNILFHSENPNGARAHAINFFRADVDVRYAGFQDMGRTTVAPLDNTTFGADGNPTKIGTNQIGRYIFHMHHVWGMIGGNPSGRQFKIIGNAMENGAKWGLAVHGSHYGLVQDNVVYNVPGAGIVTEDGSESYNLIDHNFVMRNEGSGEGPNGNRKNGSPVTTDNGHEGTAFWFRGAHNTITNNVAANPSWAGFMVMTRSLPSGTIFMPTSPGQDPRTAAKVTIRTAQPQKFHNNEVYSPVAIPGKGGQGNGYEFWTISIADPRITDATIWHTTRTGVLHGEGDHNSAYFDGLLIRFDQDTLKNLPGKNYAGLAAVSRGLTGIHSASAYTSSVKIRNADIQGGRHGMSNNIGNSAGVAFGVFEVEDSYFRMQQGIFIDYDSFQDDVVDVIRNVKFDAIPGYPLQSILTSHNGIFFNDAVTNKDPTLYRHHRVVVYDYQQVPGQNFEVFNLTQGPNAVVPLSKNYAPGGIPEPDMTVRQAWDKYGLAPWMLMATCTDTRPEMPDTIACAFATTPPKVLGQPRALVHYPNPHVAIAAGTAVTPGVLVTGEVRGVVTQGCYSLDGGAPVCSSIHPTARLISFKAIPGLAAGEHSLSVWLIHSNKQEVANSRTSTTFTIGAAAPVAPKLTFSAPAAGSTVAGSTVNVTYTKTGDMTGVDHMHLQLDTAPELRDTDFDGKHTLTNVAPGSHTLKGYLAKADHSKVPGTDTQITFTVTAQAASSAAASSTPIVTSSVASSVSSVAANTSSVCINVNARGKKMQKNLTLTVELFNAAGQSLASTTVTADNNGKATITDTAFVSRIADDATTPYILSIKAPGHFKKKMVNVKGLLKGCQPSPELQPGDINDDGKLDTSDIRAHFKYVRGQKDANYHKMYESFGMIDLFELIKLYRAELKDDE